MIRIDLLPDQIASEDPDAGGPEAVFAKREGRHAPGSVPPRRMLDPWTWILLITAAGVVIASGGMWVTLGVRERDVTERAAVLRADSMRLVEACSLSDSLNLERRKLEERSAAIAVPDRERHVWPQLLGAIAAQVPPDVWVVAIRRLESTEGTRVELQGIATNPRVVSEFARSLEEAPRIRGVQILGSQVQTYSEHGVRTHAFSLALEHGGQGREGRDAATPVASDEP